MVDCQDLNARTFTKEIDLINNLEYKHTNACIYYKYEINIIYLIKENS